MEVGMDAPVVEVYASDTSSISATSDPFEDRKMKGKVVEGAEEIEPTKEHEFIEYMRLESPHHQPSPADLGSASGGTLLKSRKRSRKPEKKEFSCNFCKKTFNNSQALGGHQNAHKHERAIVRRGKESEAAVAPHGYPDTPWYPYTHLPIAAAPAAIGYFSNPLGIRLHSSPFLHKPKPYYPNHAYTLAGVQQGLHGLTSRPASSTQTGFSRFRMGDYYHAGQTSTSRYNIGGGAARFYGGYQSASATSSITAASSNSASSTSSIPATSIASENLNSNINGNSTFGGSNGVVLRWGPLGNHHNQREEHGELDLSLKL